MTAMLPACQCSWGLCLSFWQVLHPERSHCLLFYVDLHHQASLRKLGSQAVWCCSESTDAAFCVSPQSCMLLGQQFIQNLPFKPLTPLPTPLPSLFPPPMINLTLHCGRKTSRPAKASSNACHHNRSVPQGTLPSALRLALPHSLTSLMLGCVLQSTTRQFTGSIFFSLSGIRDTSTYHQ